VKEEGAPEARLDVAAEGPPAEPLITDAARKRLNEVPDGPGGRLNRRRFLLTSAATSVAATTATIGVARSQDATPTDAMGDAAQHTMPEAAPNAEQGGFSYLVPFEAAIVQAAAARLIPTDDLGPGAIEAGVVYFIDRQLSSEKTGFNGKIYDMGPFLPGEETQGDQSALPMRDRFRLGIRGIDAYAQEVYGSGFVELAAEEQDRILRDMEEGIPETFDGASISAYPVFPASSGQEAIEQPGEAGVGAAAFFELLLAYTRAGFFVDPVQGGNRDMVGWKLIGFPGAQTSYADQILNYGQPFDGPFISLAQYQQQVSGGI